jgi:hypothetical protein
MPEINIEPEGESRRAALQERAAGDSSGGGSFHSNDPHVHSPVVERVRRVSRARRPRPRRRSAAEQILLLMQADRSIQNSARRP